jgi:hypothetical protein
MSQLNFPDNPLNGQLYPNPCPTGVTQYRWDSSTGIWRIVGVATGVVPGTYGDSVNVGQFSVDVQGNVTQAANIAIRNATLTLTGVVQLEDTLTSVSTSRALTAAAGKRLQDQIGNLNTCIVPNNANVVLALNDLQNQTFQLQQGAMIWCGYYNAQEGDISYVSDTGFRLGYRIGQELPNPGPSNGGDFFIVNISGNPYIAGDTNAPNQQIEAGNWLISEVNRWQEVDSRGRIRAIDVEYTPNFPLTAINVQSALFQITQLFRTGIGGATVSSTKPPNPYPGQLWWDNDDGLFYIYYRDQNGDQWVEASGSAGGIASGLGSGGGSVYEVKTGKGLTGGPIVTTGTVSLKPAFYNSLTPTNSEIGGVVPNLGFSYNNTSGLLNLKVSSDPQGKDPFTAFSQAGANIINSKVNFVTGKGVLAGTYDASEGVMATVTPAGDANGFVVGEGLPTSIASLNNFYAIVTVAGDDAKSGDWFVCTSTEWFLIDFQTTFSSARNIDVTSIDGLEFSGDVQSVLEDLQLEVGNRVGGLTSLSDGLIIESSGSGLFGSTATLSLLPASVDNAGVVQLTSDITGNSESLAVSQLAVSQLNTKVQSLSSGPRVLAGTFNATTGLVVSVTAAGLDAGFKVDEPAPNAVLVPENFYLIVTVSGGFGPSGAEVSEQGDWFLTERTDVGNYWAGIHFDNLSSAATNVSLAPVSNLTATNVQDGISQLQEAVDEAVWNVFVDGAGLTAEKTPLLGGAGSNVTLSLTPASSTNLGGVTVFPNKGLGINDEGSLAVLPATTAELGGVIVGDNLVVDDNGRLSAVVPPQTVPQIQLLDDVSLQFTGRRATFLATIAGNELPRTVGLAQLFVAVNGVDLRPGVDFSWDPNNSLLTISTAPAVGSTFSGRVITFS